MTHNCQSENGIVGRIQAKGDPPATPSFAPRNMNEPKTATATGITRGSILSQDSDFLDYETDGAEETQRAHAESFPGGSSSQTMGHGTESKSSSSQQSASLAPPTRDYMPNFKSQAAATPSAKRKRSVFLPDSSDEEFGGDDLDDPDVERQLAAAADESVRKKLFQTPAAERVVDRLGGGGLPTPGARAGRNGLLIADEERERGNKRLRLTGPGSSIPEEDGSKSKSQSQLLSQTQSQSQSQSLPAAQVHALSFGDFGDFGTPTPYRKTDALATPSVTGTPTSARTSSPMRTPKGGDYPKILDEAMALLEAQPISDAARQGLRQALERHEMRVRGVAMGRDVARNALAARDERIAQLQDKVVNLETRKRYDKIRLKEFTDGLMSMTQDEEEL